VNVPLSRASKSTLLGVKGAVPPVQIEGLTPAEEWRFLRQLKRSDRSGNLPSRRLEAE
jgi:hypothetical protein